MTVVVTVWRTWTAAAAAVAQMAVSRGARTSGDVRHDAAEVCNVASVAQHQRGNRETVYGYGACRQCSGSRQEDLIDGDTGVGDRESGITVEIKIAAAAAVTACAAAGASTSAVSGGAAACASAAAVSAAAAADDAGASVVCAAAACAPCLPADDQLLCKICFVCSQRRDDRAGKLRIVVKYFVQVDPVLYSADSAVCAAPVRTAGTACLVACCIHHRLPLFIIQYLCQPKVGITIYAPGCALVTRRCGMRSAAGSSGGVHAGTHEKAETGFGLRMENWYLRLTRAHAPGRIEISTHAAFSSSTYVQ